MSSLKKSTIFILILIVAVFSTLVISISDSQFSTWNSAVNSLVSDENAEAASNSDPITVSDLSIQECEVDAHCDSGEVCVETGYGKECEPAPESCPLEACQTDDDAVP
ncbi:hypothetical protein KY321_01300, partial [Candidatus Woesearchaeota archaeon]|nr:hypothetical protein [Candidatus Woesearchaeota archaeon]